MIELCVFPKDLGLLRCLRHRIPSSLVYFVYFEVGNVSSELVGVAGLIQATEGLASESKNAPKMNE